MEKVEIKFNDINLNATLVLPEKLGKKNPGLIFIHGWRSSQIGNISRAQELAKLGFVALTFDLPGHGKSGGKVGALTRKDYLEAVIRVYDFFSELGFVDSKIGVIGTSFGSYLAALLSEQRDLKWLVLRVPADYPDEGFDTLPQTRSRGVVKWRNSKESEDSTLSRRALNKFKGQLLIVESEKDRIVPHKIIESYINSVFDKKKLTHVVQKDADHGLFSKKLREEYLQILSDWLKRN